MLLTCPASMVPSMFDSSWAALPDSTGGLHCSPEKLITLLVVPNCHNIFEVDRFAAHYALPWRALRADPGQLSKVVRRRRPTGRALRRTFE